jgi:sugar phosphate permease
LSTSPPPQTADAVGRSAVRRINLRLLPFLFLLYIVAFLDRSNIGYAGKPISDELGFSKEVFGFGAGIFFIGYVLLEIPGTILVELWSARKWIARIMISWGLIAGLTGLVHTARQFYWARFLLGVAEAGFLPGVIVYLTHWYRSADRAKAIALFMSAIPLSQVIGAPLSAELMKLHWLGWSGWRWMLILEGAPAILLGMVTIFYLTDRPQHAKWLPQAERDWIVGELEAEKRVKSAAGSPGMWRALGERNVLLLTLAYFCGATLQYGLILWLPQMIGDLSKGWSIQKITIISAIPYLAAWPAMLAIGWHSDRTRERRVHTAVCMIVSGAALLAAQFTGKSMVLGLILFSIAAMGINGRLAAFWAMPSSFLSGTAAATAIGLINCIGNTGGFAGPYIVGFLHKHTGYVGGVAFLIGSAFVGAAAVLMVRKTDERKSEGVTLG